MSKLTLGEKKRRARVKAEEKLAKMHVLELAKLSRERSRVMRALFSWVKGVSCSDTNVNIECSSSHDINYDQLTILSRMLETTKISFSTGIYETADTFDRSYDVSVTLEVTNPNWTE